MKTKGSYSEATTRKWVLSSPNSGDEVAKKARQAAKTKTTIFLAIIINISHGGRKVNKPGRRYAGKLLFSTDSWYIPF